MLSRIDHVGIAVRDLDEAIRIYERRLGLRSTGRERLEREGIEIAMIPKNTVPVTNKDDIASLFKLIEALEELDDVQKVWGNFDVDDADLDDI